MQRVSTPDEQDQRRWDDACLIAQMVLIDPAGLGGIWVKSQAGPVRDQWLKGLQQLMQDQMALVKIPSNADEGALLGELDLLKSLEQQKKVYSQGVLSQIDDGLLLLPMAERIKSHTAALLTQSFDVKNQFGIIAFDESLAEEDQHLLPRLQDRLGFQIDLEALSYRRCSFTLEALDIFAVRKYLKKIEVPNEALEAMMTSAQALGIDSLRVGLYLVRAARVLAAMRKGLFLEQRDIQTAARLIFAHRIRKLPESSASEPEQNSRQEESSESEKESANQNEAGATEQGAALADENPFPESDQPETNQSTQIPPSFDLEQLQDMIIEASRAHLSENVLNAMMQKNAFIQAKEGSQGKVGQLQKGLLSGQALPSRKGKPSFKHKIDLLKTIQAASPWQKIRRIERTEQVLPTKGMIVKADDIYLKQFVQRSSSVTLFVVDASGSAAMERLSEAKGAVELLLAQCYIRRDQVALMTFRGGAVDLMLPPTRSLVRAKRLLTGMPGGGGTPLASAIQESAQFARKLKLKGLTPCIVLLTDGRANVSLAGVGGREGALADALSAAKKARIEQLPILFIDTSIKPHEFNQRIATDLGAQYLPLPQGKSASVVQAAKLLMA